MKFESSRASSTDSLVLYAVAGDRIGRRFLKILNLFGETGVRVRILAWLLAVVACTSCTAFAGQGSAPERIPSQNVDAHILHRTYPKLSEAARAQHIQGTVGVEVTISPSGDVTSVGRIIGDPTLGQVAAEAVRDWKYRPFLKDGVPVEVVTVQSVEFKPDPPSERPFIIGWSLFVVLCLLVSLAWWQLLTDKRQQPRWRRQLLSAGLTLVSLSLLQLLVEIGARYWLGHRITPTHALRLAIGVNGALCFLAALLCLIGKGAGKWASVAAIPLLYFFWGIQVVV